MSIEVGKVAEQNSALLRFLAGRWATRFTAHSHGVIETDMRVHVLMRGEKIHGLFQTLPDGCLAGSYMPIGNSTGENESTTDCFLQLELDRSDNALVAFLGNDKSLPGLKGVWSNSVLRFRGDFYDGMTMWEVFRAIWRPEITARPSTVSLVVHQASETTWLLDVAFEVEQSYSPEDTPVGLRYRLEFWHFCRLPSASVLLHPQDIEESFDELLHRCDEVTEDVEFSLNEIEEQIAILEESQAKCKEHLRLLGQVKTNVESSKDDAYWLDDDLHEAILKLHENPLVSAEGSAVAGELKGILARRWSELDRLHTEIDSIEVDVDLPDDDMIGSAWTYAEYVRAESLLRKYPNHLPPDLSFLGPLQPSVSKLSKAAAKIVETTAVLFQLSRPGNPLAGRDYGPQIASMAKACERILADVFKEKKEAIERDPVVGGMVSDERSWQYRIPTNMSKVTSGDLTNVVKMFKKSIETNTEIKWNGMGNKRIALLLFGGWIPVYQATREYVLNPLGVNSSAEFVQTLPDRLSEFQNVRNGFVHHDLAVTKDLLRTWDCFQNCLKGLLQAFYSASK